MNLHAKLTIWVVVVVLVSGLAANWVVLSIQRQSRLEDFSSFAETLGGTIRDSLRHDMLDNARERIPPRLLDLGAAELIERIRIFSRADHVAFSSIPRENGLDVAVSQEVAEVLRGGETRADYAHSRERSGERSGYSVLIPIKRESQCVTCHKMDQRVLGVVEVGLRTGALERRLSSDTRLVAMILVSMSFVLLVLMLLFLRRTVIRRVRTIIKSISQITGGNYKARVGLDSKDEFGVVAKTFNEMATQVASTIDALGKANEKLDRAFVRFGKLLSMKFNPGEIAELLAEELVESVGASEAAVLLCRADGGLVVMGQRGVSVEAVEANNHAPAVWGEQPYVPSSFPPEGLQLHESDRRSAFPKLANLHSGKSCRGFLLKAPGGPVGLITLVSGPVGELQPVAWHALELLRQEAATAIENAVLHEALEVASITDDLTRCFNRRHFFASLKDEISRADRYSSGFSLMLVDLDRFKKFNDEFGHQVGDQVLRRVAEILMSSARRSDRVFRYGGDEFALVLPDTFEEDAVILAERVREAISQTDFVPGGETAPFRLGACVGVVSYDTARFHGQVENLFKAVDDALYEVKLASRNGVGVSPVVAS